MHILSYPIRLGSILAIILLLAAGLLNPGYCETDRMRVAIVEFDVKGELDIKDAGEIIPEMLVTALGATNSFDLKERVLMKRILKEQALSLTGVLDQH